MPFASAPNGGEPDRKHLAESDLRRQFGVVLSRALALAGLSMKDVAFRLGYQDQSAISRWVAGTEPMPIAKLWACEELRGPLVMAMSEHASDVRVRMSAEWQRRRA